MLSALHAIDRPSVCVSDGWIMHGSPIPLIFAG